MKAFYSIVFVFSLLPCVGQLKSHSFAEASELSKSDPRPFVVFIHTDWCKYCQMMEHTTFKNDEVIELLNKQFYFIRFNAENPESINFGGNTFYFKPNGRRSGIHDLAVQLAQINTTVAYPTITILDADYSITLQKPSFTDAKTLLFILNQMQAE